MTKPFIRWVGGKTQLLPNIIKLVPPKFNTYYEPFIGGGAVFFALKPDHAVVNDLNSHLSDLYSDLRDHPYELIEELELIEEKYLSFSHEDRRAYYYENRSLYNMLDSSIVKSSIFLFLNKTCFNGVYRENPLGEFNVPFGKNNLLSLFDENILYSASDALKKVDVLNGSYEQAVLEAKAGDFIYFDPPYAALNSGSFTGYTGSGFGVNEQAELRDVFHDLSNKGCYVMLSNSNAPIVHDLYDGYYFHEVLASRAVNCKAQGRGKITELIITNYKTRDAYVIDAQSIN